MGEQVVVVWIDGSPASYTTLRWALSYAGRTGARVRMGPLLDTGTRMTLAQPAPRAT